MGMASPLMAPNPFQGRAHDENFPPVHGVFNTNDTGPAPAPAPRGVPPVPGVASPAGSLPSERSGARRARPQQSPGGGSPFGSAQSGMEDMASADFRDAGEALCDLSNMEDSIDMQFLKAEVLPDFQVGQTPVNQRRGPLETPTTYATRKEREEHEIAAEQLQDQQFFESRMPAPGSTPKKTPPVLFDPKTAGPTPQQPPRSAGRGLAEDSAGSRRRGGTGASASPVLWGNMPASSTHGTPASIPEDRQPSSYGSSNGDFGRGVTGGMEDREMQTDCSIAPNMLCQLVPCSPSGSPAMYFGGTPGSAVEGSRGANGTPAGLGARLAAHHRAGDSETPSPHEQQQQSQQPFAASISPMTGGTPAVVSIAGSAGMLGESPPEQMMTGFPGLHSVGVQSPADWSLKSKAESNGDNRAEPEASPIAAPAPAAAAVDPPLSPAPEGRQNTQLAFSDCESPPSGFFGAMGESESGGSRSPLSAPHVSGSTGARSGGNDVTRGRHGSSSGGQRQAEFGGGISGVGSDQRGSQQGSGGHEFGEGLSAVGSSQRGGGVSQQGSSGSAAFGSASGGRQAFGSQHGSGQQAFSSHSNRSLPPPQGVHASPIAQSQSPAHIAQSNSPDEFGRSPERFGDDVGFEPSPIRDGAASPGDVIGSMSSIRSAHAQSPEPAARRSLEQHFSEADSEDLESLQMANSPDVSRDVANTLSFSPPDGEQYHDIAPVIHGGSGLLGSRTSMQQSIRAFSDESSGGHEFGDGLSGVGSSQRGGGGMSSARSLGRDSERPSTQRTHSREIATETRGDERLLDGARSRDGFSRDSRDRHAAEDAAAMQHQGLTHEQAHHRGGGGTHKVGAPVEGQQGNGQLWMVDSDHREEPTQASPDHAFLQGTMQQGDESAPPRPHKRSTSAEVNQDMPPAQQHHHQVSPPAIGGATGASPLYAAAAAAGFGQAMGHMAGGQGNYGVAADYVAPSHQRYQQYAVRRDGPRAAGASPTPTGGAATPPTSTERPYSPPAGYGGAYGVGTAQALSTAYAAAAGAPLRPRPATVLGMRTLSPSAGTHFVSPLSRLPPTFSTWRSPLGGSLSSRPYPSTSALLRPSATSLSFHRHYGGLSSSPVFSSGMQYR